MTPLSRRHILLSGTILLALARPSPAQDAPSGFDFTRYMELIRSICEQAFAAGEEFRRSTQRRRAEDLLDTLNSLAEAKRSFGQLFAEGADPARLEGLLAGMSYYLSQSFSALDDLDPGWRENHAQIIGYSAELLRKKAYYLDEYHRTTTRGAFVAKMVEEGQQLQRLVSALKIEIEK